MRALLAGVLLLVGALLVPVSTAAWWLKHDLVSTSGYVDTVAPLATDPAVVDQVEQALVTQTMQAIVQADIVTRTDTALDSGVLPPAVVKQLRGAQGSTAARVQALVAKAVHVVVENPEFATVWQAANRGAHEQIIGVLEGDTKALEIRRDQTVDVRLSALSESIKRELVKAGVPFASSLPRIEATFPVGDVQDLQRARTAYTALDTYGSVLPLVTAVLILLGLVVAKRRRRALGWTAFLSLLGLGATYLALVVGREIYLASVPSRLTPASAEAFFDILTAGLRHDLAWVALGAAVLLVLAVVVRRPGRRRNEDDLEPWD